MSCCSEIGVRLRFVVVMLVCFVVDSVLKIVMDVM